MPLQLNPLEDRIEIVMPECPRCGSPQRIYHYFMKRLTRNRNESFVDNENEKVEIIHDFEFACPLHTEKNLKYHMNQQELNLINQYKPSQFKMIIESEPQAKKSERTFYGDDIKKVKL
jgi:hypothetical protein